MGYPHYTSECDHFHDLVRDFTGRHFSTPRPTITVLCGSTRFGAAFQDANLRLTVAGHIVLSIGCDMKADHELWSDPAEAKHIKADLDELHRRKIELADEVYVLNVGGYIGESTRAEIAYAEQLGRPIAYLEALPPPTTTCCAGTGFADYAAVPCPNPACTAKPMEA